MSIGIDQHGLSPSEVANSDLLRSQVARQLIAARPPRSAAAMAQPIPKVLVQYWDDLAAVPTDVQRCLDSWSALEADGFERTLFDDASGRDFVESVFETRHLRAFDRCSHPAMRADYFRLCFIAKEGGLYVDADDVYLGSGISSLVEDSLLKVQPLCYDIGSDSMIDAVPAAMAASSDRNNLIFYVNNNPIAAPPNHPVVLAALERSTKSLLDSARSDRDIQSLTGPGNITAALVKHALELDAVGSPFDFDLLRGWESTSRSDWSLAYRADARNWRNWVRGEGDRL